jgi:hypothetical protein
MKYDNFPENDRFARMVAVGIPLAVLILFLVALGVMR